jgi:hypothetical protein
MQRVKSLLVLVVFVAFAGTPLDKPRSRSEELFRLKKLIEGEQAFFIAVHPALKDTLTGLKVSSWARCSA